MILVATDAAAPSTAFLRRALAGDQEGRAAGAGPRPRDRGPVGRPLRFDDVPVLTDDYAPTDALLTD